MTTTSNHTDLKLAASEQRLIVTYEDPDLDQAARHAIADGWIHRRISREFATCDPDKLACHVFAVVRGHTLELGHVDLDAE